jgi:signal transduction histidine kinase
MELHTQTTIFMVCMAYLVLHAVIWIALSEHNNKQIGLWCSSGLISGVAVILLTLRSSVGEFVFVYIGQLLMLVGTIGRLIALRLYLDKPITRPLLNYVIVGALFYIPLSIAFAVGTPDAPLILFFFSFYGIVCIEFVLIGLALYKKSPTLGSRLVTIAGLFFSISLSLKAILIKLGYGAHDLYGPGIDQHIMIVGQFAAITLSNIGFLRIFLERNEQSKLQIQRSLAASEEITTLLTQHKSELQNLLVEREEIIRQLTLSNKTAGMGALVASLAHELNQPLCAIRLNAKLVERKLEEPEVDTNAAKKFLDSVITDNRRAADIITKLRSMFDGGERKQGLIDFDELVRDTVSLVVPRAKEEQIDIHIRLEGKTKLNGDQTQLQQVMLNLLNNAVDAFPDSAAAEKTITVQTETQGKHLLLSVEDNGSGIAEELRLSVFELFKTTKAQGMGVGLWLSKAVVNAHAGEINFSSANGQGTRFEVRLPLA